MSGWAGWRTPFVVFLLLPVIERHSMRITSKGQVTIPKAIREQLGLLPNTEVEFVVDGDAVRIVKASQPKGESRGQRLVRLLKGSATGGMTTDEIMELTRGE